MIETNALPRAAVAQVLEQAKALHDAVRTIVHGTTSATNAIIKRKGACTARHLWVS